MMRRKKLFIAIIIGGKAKASVVEIGNNKGLIQYGIAKLGAEAGLGYESYLINAGASAYITKYELGVNIPLPFTERKLKPNGEVALGTIGVKGTIGKKTGLFVGLGVGLGFTLSIE